LHVLLLIESRLLRVSSLRVSKVAPVAASLRLYDLMLGVVSGVAVGLILGLIGGGGSVFAVPLLIYAVGVPSAHVAIGTSAVAVAVNAAFNLALHSRQGTAKWRCACLFAIAAIVGAWAGSSLGKAIGGHELLGLFGALMIVIGALMLRRPTHAARADVHLDAGSVAMLGPRLTSLGFFTGGVSGFFGIGGEFLIVPSLMLATDMPMIAAIGSSLVAVTAFGVTTAVNYTTSELVDWPLAMLFVAGGMLGGMAGSRLSVKWSSRRRALSVVFSVVVMTVGTYMILRTLQAFHGGS
jgi:uncharacterized membrane protein YfcA